MISHNTDEQARLRAALRAVSDYLEGLLDGSDQLPGKGRSQDDKDAIFGWWENRYAAVKNAQEILTECAKNDQEKIRLHQEALAREEETRKARIVAGICEVRATLEYK